MANTILAALLLVQCSRKNDTTELIGIGTGLLNSLAVVIVHSMNTVAPAKSRPDFTFSAHVKRFFQNPETRMTQPQLADRLQIPCSTLRSYLSGVAPFPVAVRADLEKIMQDVVNP